MSSNLVFKKAKTSKEIREIHEHTLNAFSDTPDFEWSVEALQQEVKEGWELFSAISLDGEIVAAALYKKEGNTLHTKNTAIKMSYQGSGFSHEIKDFFEKEARRLKVKKIVHYCRIDNFRMYSLNESHGFKKTQNKLGEDGQVVEWVKVLK